MSAARSNAEAAWPSRGLTEMPIVAPTSRVMPVVRTGSASTRSTSRASSATSTSEPSPGSSTANSSPLRRAAVASCPTARPRRVPASRRTPSPMVWPCASFSALNPSRLMNSTARNCWLASSRSTAARKPGRLSSPVSGSRKASRSRRATASVRWSLCSFCSVTSRSNATEPPSSGTCRQRTSIHTSRPSRCWARHSASTAGVSGPQADSVARKQLRSSGCTQLAARSDSRSAGSSPSLPSAPSDACNGWPPASIPTTGQPASSVMIWYSAWWRAMARCTLSSACRLAMASACTGCIRDRHHRAVSPNAAIADRTATPARTATSSIMMCLRSGRW